MGVSNTNRVLLEQGVRERGFPLRRRQESPVELHGLACAAAATGPAQRGLSGGCEDAVRRVGSLEDSVHGGVDKVVLLSEFVSLVGSSG